MLLLCPRETSDPRLCRITLDDEVVGLGWLLTLDHAVQDGEAKLVHLSALGFDSIVERTMAQLLRNQALCTRSDPRLHVLSRQAGGLAHVGYTPQHRSGRGVL